MEPNERIARTFYESVHQRDFNAALECVDERCKFIDFAQGKRVEGRAAIREDFDGWFAAFPDGRIQINNIIAAGDDVVVEYTGRGTQTGPLGKGAEALPPTGRQVELPFCDVLRFQSGRIVSMKTYYDLAGMLRQLGVGPMLGAKAERAEARPPPRS